MEERAHRAAMEREAWAFQRRGQWMGLTIGLVALVASVVLTLFGHDGVGGIIGGGTVVGLVGAFISGRRPKTEQVTAPRPSTKHGQSS